MSERKSLWCILIEHGGQRVPKKWYRWLEQLTGGRIRGQEDVASVFNGRGGLNDSFVTVQEGAIVTGSESLARSLTAWLRNGISINGKEGHYLYRPKAILMGQITIEEAMAMSPVDEAFIRNMESTFGRRGRKPKGVDETVWTVACYECVSTYQVEAEHVITCPKCHATAINSRLGSQVAYELPDSGDVIQDWMRQRFGTGNWEPASNGTVTPPEALDIRFTNNTHESIVSSFMGSRLSKQIGAATVAEALKVLDAIFVAQVSKSKDARSKDRASAALILFRDYNADPKKVVLAENQDDFDILDCSSTISPEFAAALFNRWLMNEKGNSNE